jgi:glutamate synthase (ferredoxin)
MEDPAHVQSTISKLQQAVRLNSPESYKEYSKMVNDQSENLMTIRGLFEFNNLDPISIDEVEPWTEIVKIQNRCHVLWIHQPKHMKTHVGTLVEVILEGGEDPKRFQRLEWRL